jgi:tryptophan synthase alpha subunit
MPNTKSVGIAFSDPQLDGAVIGNTAALGGTVGFYGKTPVVQRAAAIQAASVVSAASYISVSTNLSVFAAEVAATLTALGLWKGTA